MTNVFDVPRSLHGRTTEEAELWLGPNGYTLLAWEVDFRRGGAARLRLRSSEGEDRWLHGASLEIAEPERLVFHAVDAPGAEHTPRSLALSSTAETALGTLTFRRA